MAQLCRPKDLSAMADSWFIFIFIFFLLVIPVLGRERQEELWGLLANQIKQVRSWPRRNLVSASPCLPKRKENVDCLRPEEQHTQTDLCTYT